MAAKTFFQKHEILSMLNQYDIGTFIDYHALPTGSVETNYIIFTTTGKYVLRYYENRTVPQVRFEIALIDFLTANSFPCAKMLPSKENNI